MKLSRYDIITKMHLIISVLIVVPVAFVYGFDPNYEIDIQLSTIDEHNFFKAIMGLYLGFSILWLLGIFKKRFLKVALIANLIFMLGLGFGRLVSIVIDGTPTFAFQYGTVGELFIGAYGFWLLNSPYFKKP